MTELGTIIDAHTVRFERRLPGPIERVWDHLTKPEYLATWLAAGEMDLRVGGRVELCFDVGEVPQRARAGAIIRGVVSRAEPPRLLACSWIDASTDLPAAEGPVADSAVSFELEARGEQVLLVLTHRRLPTAFLANCGAGWHTHLGILLARLRGEQPEPFLSVYRQLLPAYVEQVATLEAGAQSA
jgi:uncharacterized protein YndB with AHSA1/START domain